MRAAVCAQSRTSNCLALPKLKVCDDGVRSWVPALVALVVLAGVMHPAVAVVFPSARVAWSTAWILVWVAWATVGVPGVLTGWSRVLGRRELARLMTELDGWRAKGQPVDASLGQLVSALVDSGRGVLLLSVLKSLEDRRSADARVEALCTAGHAWLGAAGFGSGAFHGDGWASLTLQERTDAVRVAASAL